MPAFLSYVCTRVTSCNARATLHIVPIYRTVYNHFILMIHTPLLPFYNIYLHTLPLPALLPRFYHLACESHCNRALVWVISAPPPPPSPLPPASGLTAAWWWGREEDRYQYPRYIDKYDCMYSSASLSPLSLSLPLSTLPPWSKYPYTVEGNANVVSAV